MSEKCSDISQNITKLNFPGENLGFTTEIDGRENREDFLNFPFDHMYACSSDNSDLNSDRQAGESEVRHLKDLLLLHLDLIQHQSDEIVTKDKYITQLQQENEMLKQRLNRTEHCVNFQHNNRNNSLIHNSNSNFSLDFSDNMTHDTGFCAEIEDSKDALKLMGLCSEDSDYKAILPSVDRRSADRDSGESMGSTEKFFNLRGGYNSTSNMNINDCIIKIEPDTDSNILTESFLDSTSVNTEQNTHLEDDDNNSNNIEMRQFDLRLNNRRKRFYSTSSQFSHNESLEMKSRTFKKRRKGIIERISILTTDGLYITQSGPINYKVEDISIDYSIDLEVPTWRIKLLTSCYSMEGTENTDDEVYNRRHCRLENDERRRKRWDVQRIREQRHVERLKQRQEKQAAKLEEGSSEPIATFLPPVEDIRYIHVSDELPISAFGSPIAKLAPSEFRLPWLNGNAIAKKPPNRKATTRRKSQRR